MGRLSFFNVNLEYYNKNGAQLLMKTKHHPLPLCDCGLNTSHINLFRNLPYFLFRQKYCYTPKVLKKNLLFFLSLCHI